MTIYKILKSVRMGERVLEPGYEIDTSRMDFYTNEGMDPLVESGHAEKVFPVRKAGKPTSTEVLNAVLD